MKKITISPVATFRPSMPDDISVTLTISEQVVARNESPFYVRLTREELQEVIKLAQKAEEFFKTLD